MTKRSMQNKSCTTWKYIKLWYFNRKRMFNQEVRRWIDWTTRLTLSHYNLDYTGIEVRGGRAQVSSLRLN